MRKILLTMLLLVAAIATMRAQDEIEQTDAPVICYEYDEYSVMATITIDPVDPATEMIYWRYVFEEGEWTEWMIYEGPICFDVMGIYQLEAYATSPGKIDSDIVCLWFEIHEPTDMYHVQIADFGVDGIYYKFTSDSTVMVSLNDTYDYPYTEPFGWELYSECPYSGDVVIPSTVEFEGKTYTVEGIDSFAFINSTLSSITLPNTIKFISNRAFIHATIESGSIFIPASVTTIEAGAFADCYNLENVQVDENNPVFDSRDNCNAIIETATNTLAVAFNSTIIPSNVTAIGNDAFAGDAYSIFGYYCGCAITDIVIPNSVKTIGNRAFYMCSYLKDITIGNEVTEIGDYAFFQNGLTSVTISNSTNSIGTGAFCGCYSLTKVLCMPTSTPDAGTNAFDGGYEQATLFVPNEAVEDYRAHEEWGKFSHIVPFIGAGPGDVNGDGNIAISDATNLIDMLLGGNELPAWADVNGDGNVTIADVTVLIDMLLGN